MSQFDFLSRLQGSKNVLLMKDEIGKPKPSIHALPDVDFSYGKPEAKDIEGVYERNPYIVTHHWQEHRPTAAADPEKDYQRLNVMSVARRLVKPRDIAQFRKKTDARVQRRVGQLPTTPKPPGNIYFGVPSLASDSMKEIMTNGYGNAAAAQLRLNYEQNQKEKSIFKPRTLSVPATKSRSPHQQTALFKLRKFQQVPSRVNSHRD